ncbi:MAG: hypothetical protein ABJB40_03735 [Acidobacteriota bacterium]
MRSLLPVSVIMLLASGLGLSQTRSRTAVRPAPKPTPAIVPVEPSVDTGTVSGRTYTNETFNFEVTFPDTWLIPDSDFEAYMKKQGFGLSLKAPDSLPPASKTAINQAIKRVDVLLTAYRSLPGSAENAIVRISVEDLKANPQIKDAVDYFDAIRAMYATMKLPADFKYSETRAEKLGAKQFGFLDVTSTAGKKRMYATVRNGFAIMFTVSYTDAADLATFRHVLEYGNFNLK